MGRLNWNGNRQPKLSYKSEGLERLFLQLIKEKLTNPDKFLWLSYLKILNSPYLLPLLEFPSLNISFKELWEKGGTILNQRTTNQLISNFRFWNLYQSWDSTKDLFLNNWKRFIEYLFLKKIIDERAQVLLNLPSIQKQICPKSCPGLWLCNSESVNSLKYNCNTLFQSL